jgi:hypothetical protein
MTKNAITGNGATLAGSVYTVALDIVSIGENERSVEDLNISVLSSTGAHKFIPGDLFDGGEVSMVALARVGVALPVIGGANQTWTLTFPKEKTTDTAATLSGTGYVKSISSPSFENDTVATIGITIKFDGKTGPAYAAGTAGA